MSLSISRSPVLLLYRQLLRESNKFDSYIYRKYAFRRIRDAFRTNKNQSDPKVIDELIKDGHNNLEVIRRQVIVNNLYKSNKLVVEGLKL